MLIAVVHGLQVAREMMERRCTQASMSAHSSRRPPTRAAFPQRPAGPPLPAPNSSECYLLNSVFLLAYFPTCQRGGVKWVKLNLTLLFESGEALY